MFRTAAKTLQSLGILRKICANSNRAITHATIIHPKARVPNAHPRNREGEQKTRNAGQKCTVVSAIIVSFEQSSNESMEGYSVIA